MIGRFISIVDSVTDIWSLSMMQSRISKNLMSFIQRRTPILSLARSFNWFKITAQRLKFMLKDSIFTLRALSYLPQLAFYTLDLGRITKLSNSSEIVSLTIKRIIRPFWLSAQSSKIRWNMMPRSLNTVLQLSTIQTLQKCGTISECAFMESKSLLHQLHA